MINTDTVFVLGAGASMPYGFPSGAELLQKIISYAASVTKHVTEKDEFYEADVDVSGIESFAERLKYSGEYSIDSFLEKNPGYVPMGKYMIAKIIMGYENAEKLYKSTEDWYRYLLGKMDAPNINEFIKNKVTFLTFNYDRSLEQFLYNAVTSRYGLTPQEGKKAMDEIKIIHLHGKLGFLPWEVSYDSIPYGVENSMHPTKKSFLCRFAYKNIKIIHEDVEEGFVEAQQLLTNSSRIYFLGVGYHPLNMSRLGTINIPTVNKHILGTGFGYTDHEISQIAKGSKITILPRTSLDLLRNNAFLT